MTVLDCLRSMAGYGLGVAGTPGSQISGAPGSSKLSTATDANTSSGNSRDNVHSVTLVASSDFSGTVMGKAFTAGATINFTAPPGYTVAAFAYTVAAGTLTAYYIL